MASGLRDRGVAESSSSTEAWSGSRGTWLRLGDGLAGSKALDATRSGRSAGGTPDDA